MEKKPIKLHNAVPIIIIILLVSAMIWINGMLISENASGPLFFPVGQAALVQAATPTPFPEEIIKNREMTREIILVGILLVVIIIGGTLSVITRK